MRIAIKILNIIVFLFLSESAMTQAITWQREYTSYPQVEGSSIVQLFDGGYIFCGQSLSNKFVVLRTNNLGDPIWKRDFEGLYPKKIIQTLDSGVLIVGMSQGRSGFTTDSYILKLNLIGDSLWSRKYGLLYFEDQFTDVLELESGNLLILGWSRFGDAESKIKMSLLKTSPNGDSLGMQYYENSGGSNLMSKLNNNKILLTGSTALIVDTSGYMIAFSNEQYGKGVSFGNNLYFVKEVSISGKKLLKITKTKENFEIIDTNFLSIPDKILHEHNLIKFDIGILSCGFAIRNTTGEAGGYILSLDSNCKIMWYKDYFLLNRNLKFEGLSACFDKGFISIGDNYQLSSGISFITATKTDSLGNTTLLNINKEQTINSEEYTLFQNYPNPFNSQTTIKFYLKKKSNVRISIFNNLGKSIELLVDNGYEAGTHKIIYNANSNLPSGLYFYIMQVTTNLGNTRKTKKFVLIK